MVSLRGKAQPRRSERDLSPQLLNALPSAAASRHFKILKSISLVLKMKYELNPVRIVLVMQTALTGLSLLAPGKYPMRTLIERIGGVEIWSLVFIFVSILILVPVRVLNTNLRDIGYVLCTALWGSVTAIYVGQLAVTPILAVAVVNCITCLWLIMVDHDAANNK